MEELLQTPERLLQNLPVVWTFMLLMTRFTGLMLVLPGLGGGASGLIVRFPAIFVLAVSSLFGGRLGTLPENLVLMAMQLACEFSFGILLGMLPQVVVAGAQTAGQIMSSSMGLTGSQLFDPSVGGAITDISRILGDTVIIIFLLTGGYHEVIYAAAGLGAKIVPGTFVPGEIAISTLVDCSAQIFRFAVMISAPVVVALLLTQFVMGMISRAVPTVNIFIISFPLTIGIGLMISVLALPDIAKYTARHLREVDNVVLQVTREAQVIEPEAPPSPAP